MDLWDCCANLAQMWWTRHGGVPAADVANHRLQALLRHAHEHSPFYRWRHGHVGGEGARLADLPVVGKTELMANFDDWVTDSRIKRADVERFIATRSVGERFLDRFVAWKSSGSSGVPGLFVQDRHALVVYDALVASRFEGEWWASATLPPVARRTALVAATHDHFASIVSWEHARRAYPGGSSRSFSVLEPMPKLVAGLNEFRPAFLASYPSVLALLADERRAGRLKIEPDTLWSGGEFLAPAVRRHIESAFGAPLVNEYGASECLSIATGCREDRLHVHADWVLLEPVDAHYRPVPPGHLSHTVLLTNLANWIQPIIRYDLGDRVTLLPGPCPCGSVLPALRVEGRTDATLHLRSARGTSIAIAPLALSTVVEDATGVYRFQVVQRSADALALRFPGPDAGKTAAWKCAQPALQAFLDRHGLANVHLALDRQAPRADRASGKLRTVVGLATWKG